MDCKKNMSNLMEFLPKVIYFIFHFIVAGMIPILLHINFGDSANKSFESEFIFEIFNTMLLVIWFGIGWDAQNRIKTWKDSLVVELFKTTAIHYLWFMPITILVYGFTVPNNFDSIWLILILILYLLLLEFIGGDDATKSKKTNQSKV